MKDFIKAILAGLLISLAASCYMLIDNKYLGSFIFSLGLIVILTFELNLYTGKIGYIVTEKITYLKRILIITLGNIVGTVLSSYLLLITRYGTQLKDKANYLSNIKLQDNILSLLILAILCGLLMYIAVDGFKNIKHEIGKYLIVVLCIMAFILAGFEHSIANVVYLTLAGSIFSLTSLKVILIALVGNCIGAILIPLSKKI